MSPARTRARPAPPPEPRVEFTPDGTGLVRSWMAMTMLALDEDAVTFGEAEGPWRLVMSRQDWGLYGRPEDLRVWAEVLR